MTFENYLIYQLVASVVGVVVLLPLCLWWLRHREAQRKAGREKRDAL